MVTEKIRLISMHCLTNNHMEINCRLLFSNKLHFLGFLLFVKHLLSINIVSNYLLGNQDMKYCVGFQTNFSPIKSYVKLLGINDSLIEIVLRHLF